MRPGHPVFRIVALAAALFLLNASLTFESAWPTPGIRWTGALSIEMAIVVLALSTMASLGRVPSGRLLFWLAAAWLVMALGHYAAVTATALYGRELNLFWDLRFVPDVLALLARPEKVWVLVLAAVGAAAGVLLLFRLFHLAMTRLGRAVAHPAERRTIAAAAALLLVLRGLTAAGIEIAGGPQFAPPVIGSYVRQARLMAEAFTRTAAVPPGPPMDSDLSLVKGADVLVFFIEAYGAVSFDRPEFARRLTPDRAALEAAIDDTDRDVVSAYVESPTFGGSSWLAHITLLSGIEVRDHDTNALLMREKRDTLVTNFKRRGYRTVAVMPGLWQAWPEGAFYGFDEIYGGERLDYHGPQFGWWDMTDQYALAKLDALEIARAPRPPLFVVLPTISTHIPFTPTPPYQPDWGRMLTAEPYDEADLETAYDKQPDWLDLGPSYVDAVSYLYKSIAGYLRLHPDRDFVLVLVGDHQPAAAVSGEAASWEVPVHVIADTPGAEGRPGRAAVIERLIGRGFVRGLSPAHPALGPMHALTPVLLDAFGDRSRARKDLAAGQ